ncbi:radical SAM/SPASM domain-containing protein [Vallitalea guaymasensis]|uniref:radical SAM/SPASM domain-containing protein n=1 Tax=Vallitalea guaymasensis TaxID=1185412 RepID=UPI000DE3C3D0|nr:radical SAM/SPASM domain-containing protein [Vallitalea guaymasensis]
MIINPYKNGVGKIKSYLEKKCPKALEKHILPRSVFVFDRLFTHKSKKLARKYLSMKEFPVFQTIEVETINRCNGSCAFCPVNKNNDPRPFKIMDESLLTSILTQLQEINYSGSFGLYSNNEPLLDKRLIDLLKRSREALPNAELFLFTNGSLLTIDKFIEIRKYLDKLIIDNYNDQLEANEKVKIIDDYNEKNPSDCKVFIYLRKENEVLTNRGGQANNRTSNKFKLKSSCMYPFEQVIVRPDGKLSLCCNDATGKITMGDLTKERLIDIWRGEKYQNLRKMMLKDRSLHQMCKNCDVVTPKFASGSTFHIKNIFKMLANKNTAPKNKRLHT